MNDRCNKIKSGIKEIWTIPFYFAVFASLATVLPVTDIAPAVAETVTASSQQGFYLLKKGWVNDAIAVFQKVLKRQPQSLQTKIGLAIAYNRAGRITDAWNAYQQVLAQDPNNQLALKTVGILSTYRSEWNQRGIAALSTVLKLNANDAQARAYRALLYSYQGQFSESLADYQIALSHNPTLDVILGAAQTYSYSGNYQKSLELFNRYRAAGKAITGYAAVAYGSSLRETGNPAAAVKVLEAQLQRSRTLDRLAIETRAELAKAYVANLQPAKAMAVLDSLQGRPDATLSLARSLNEIRKLNRNPALTQQVATLYRQALAQTSNPSPALLREVADVFTGLPHGEQTALQLYQQLAPQFPNDQSLVVRQLALENKLGRLAKNDLKQQLLSQLQTLPTDPVQLQQLALALADIDDPDPQLLPIYQNILPTGVNVPFLDFRLAQMYVQQNNLKEARQALAIYTATPQGAKDLTTQILAAEIERREGNLDASAQRYQAVLASKPDTDDIVDSALRGLAGVRVQQKRWEDALIVYDQLIARNPQNLSIQLGRASIAYQAKKISQQQAEAVLNNWLATQPVTNTPSELFSLVGALPADPQREALYKYLIQVNPNYIPLQLRLVQVLAKSHPAQARMRVKQWIARLPKNPSSYQLQAELGQAIGDLNLASSAYEKIVAQQPDNIDALAALGGIRFQQQRYESAQQMYKQVLAQNPEDKEARRALAGLNAIFDQPLTALGQLEQLQLEQLNQGRADPELSHQMQHIQEDFLLRRGFQPPWEDYQRRGRY
jgi:tetratricopeptide (TPR) repeat protein